MASPEHSALLISLILLSLLSACGGRPVRDSAPGSNSVPGGVPPDAVPRKEPRSKYGNGPIYEVLGVSYQVLASSNGYQERGVASWYGQKFHGQPTSSREPYNMYAMTAAHRTLPLPTYVQVRNLRNNKVVVVRVNDRGPFVDNRIIDLSYSAALKLDMIKDGTSLVEVTALSVDDPPRYARQSASEQTTDASVFVQVGAFGDADNARRRFALLRDGGIGKAFVHEDHSSQQTLYRVRIGPIANVNQYDSLVVELTRLGIFDPHLVTE